MAPYSESIEVTPYISRTKVEIIRDGRKYKKNLLNRLEQNHTEPNDWEKALLGCATDEDFYEHFIDEDTLTDKEGNELTTYNPDSKWDWYEVGGRWSGLIKTKSGQCVDSAMIKDIDFSPDKKEYEMYKRWWEVAIDGEPLKKGEKKEDFESWYKKEYYLDRYKDKETYAKLQTSLSTFAVVTPDGKWNEKGSMGWFGTSSETGDESYEWDTHFKERFIDTFPEDTIVTIVDCHI